MKRILFFCKKKKEAKPKANKRKLGMRNRPIKETRRKLIEKALSGRDNLAGRGKLHNEFEKSFDGGQREDETRESLFEKTATKHCQSQKRIKQRKKKK